ncbi:MAG: anthranilate synthase component I family protein [Planctomycetota bacterium]|nr:anthranilate synthase component I family protein [Planctomycetota bacterium]
MALLTTTTTAALRLTPLSAKALPSALLEALAREDSPVLLDSSALHPELGRYSVVGCRPIEVITLSGGRLCDAAGGVLAQGQGPQILQRLGQAFAAVKLAAGAPAVPYAPGWIGYVGYEVGRCIERLPGRARRDTHLPDLRLAFYDALLVYDSLAGAWRLAELVFDRPVAGAGEAGKRLVRLLAEASVGPSQRPASPAEAADATVGPGAPDATCNFTPDQYRRAVARAVEYIAAGDIFQVNLSQRFTVAGVPAPAAIYRALRGRNPAWYAAYLAFEHAGAKLAVLSSSPELFLRVRGGLVTTRPIKGTRPRIGQGHAARAAAAELVVSEKGNAELAMIIDLLRNDLGRVCRFGSVRVTDPVRLETHPTLFHLVGTVEGVLREGVGPADLLAATFPGGSITGAPKIRAMEIIDELEGLARGVYTGCIGHVGVDGSCEWNIAIRTIVCDGDLAHVQVGGGIVADSLPDGEYLETLHKARALLEAIALARGGVGR